jgi:hypothetical protein
MNARKFKIICNGKFRGFIFISDYQGNYECKIGTIAPFSLETNDEGESEIIGLQHTINIYLPEISDEQIKIDLIERVIFDNCLKMEIVSMS